MADDRELRLKVKVDDQASRPLHNIGDSADDAVDAFGGLNVGLKKLDKQVDETKRSIGDLREEVARSGDLGLLKDIQKQEQRLKAFERQKKSLLGNDKGLLGDGEREADTFFLKFTQRLGPLMASAPLSPPMQAAVGTAAAAAAPILTSTLSAAVTAGVTLGVVAAGIKLASQDPEVQAAGKKMGAELGAGLKDAAKPFVPATLKSISIVRAGFRSLKPELDGLFADSAKYVEPLTHSVVDAAGEITSSLKVVVDNADPVVEVLSKHGPQAAAAFGSALESMSQDSENAADALNLVLTGIEGTIVSTGKMVEWTNKLLPAQTAWVLQLLNTKDNTQKTADATAGLAGEQQKLLPPVMGVTDAARHQVGALDELATKLREQTDPMFALIGAQHDLGAAQRDYTAAVKEHGKNSPAAREALRKEAQAALGVESAAGKAAGSFDGKLTPAMKATLKAAGWTDDKIAALERQFRTAKAAGDKFAKTYKANVVVTYQGLKKDFIGPIAPTAPWAKKSAGGPVVGPGPKGVDSVPILAAPGEEILSVPDVDAMGGPSAVERMRRQIRSGQRATAVSGAGTGGAQQVVHVLRFDTSGSDRSILSAFLKAIRDAGGNPGVLGV